jgi:hypothetical protein
LRLVSRPLVAWKPEAFAPGPRVLSLGTWTLGAQIASVNETFHFIFGRSSHAFVGQLHKFGINISYFNVLYDGKLDCSIWNEPSICDNLTLMKRST